MKDQRDGNNQVVEGSQNVIEGGELIENGADECPMGGSHNFVRSDYRRANYEICTKCGITQMMRTPKYTSGGWR